VTRAKRILIIRTGGLGDFILSLPLMRALATTWPDAELEVLGRPEIAVLAGSLIACGRSIDDHRFARLFSDTPLEMSDAGAVYLSSFDFVVSFLGTPDSDFGRKLRSIVSRTLFIPAAAPGTKHAVTQFLEALKSSVEAQVDDHIPRIELSAEARDAGVQLLQSLLGRAMCKRSVIVHVGSGGRRKNWPPHLFVQVIRLFLGAGSQVILLQGEADEDAVRKVLAQVQVPVLEGASLVQVAGVIACCQLVIGNDSGISHLAAAVGTPLVCLFGPTEPAVWQPLGSAVCVLKFEDASPERVYAEGIRLLTGRTRTDTD
jgi:heptosyltransferase-3